jgi:hypothetical protein
MKSGITLPLCTMPYLADIHQVVNEAVLFPVDAVDLPRELILPLALVVLIHCFLHLQHATVVNAHAHMSTFIHQRKVQN